MRLPKFKTWEIGLVLLILIIGGSLRLYHLPDTIMFRGDQGRDAIIAKRILKDRDIALIGPVTSVGNMYLGPFYYYFMVPFLALSYPSPLGPAYGVAFLNILTIMVLYLVARSIFGKKVALVATGIFSIMPLSVLYSRFSWNPNIAPLFSILLFWSLHQWWQKQSWKNTVLVWLWVGILAQLHYVSLIAAGLALLVMCWRAVYHKEFWMLAKKIAAGLGVFLLTQAPLVAFDFRHNHLIWNQFIQFFSSDEKHLGYSTLLSRFSIILDRFYLVMTGIVGTDWPGAIDRWLSWGGLVAAMLVIIFIIKHKTVKAGEMIMMAWLGLTVVGISFYSHSVFPHYLTFCYPIIALFWGWLGVTMWKIKWARVFAVVLFTLIGYSSIKGLNETVGWNGLGTSIMEATVKASLPHLSAPYNIVLLSDDRDYKGMSYRYFFEVADLKPQELDDYGDLSSLALIDEVNTTDPRLVPIYELEAVSDFTLTETINIDNGPRVLILKKE